MIQRRILTIAALILFCLPTNSFAGGGWNGNGWYGVWLTRACVGDDLVYYLNIGMGSSFVSQQVLKFDGLCKCKKGSAREGERPHDAACFISTNLTGGAQQGANTQATAANTGAGGPSGPPPALRPALEGIAQTAFTPTVPYRSFPFSLLGASPSMPQQSAISCDSSVNPSAFVVFHQDGTVVRTNMCTGDVLATIPVTSNPLQVQVTPDGAWAIVTSYDNAISFIDTNTNKVAKVIQTDFNTFPAGISISPDGNFALVTSYIDANPALLVVDIQKQAITSRIPLDREYPQSVFLNPEGTLAWVTYPFDNAVEVVDVMTGNINRAIAVQEPIDVVFNPTGTVAYISSATPGSVVAVNTTTYAQINNVPTGAGASDLQLSPDGGFLRVNNFDDSSVSVIDTSSMAVVNTTAVTGQPIGTALAPVH